MCLKDDANSHLSGSLWDGAQQLGGVGEVNEGMCVMENWLLIGFELWSLFKNPAVTTTDQNPVECGNLKNFIYPSVKSCNNLRDISLP